MLMVLQERLPKPFTDILAYLQQRFSAGKFGALSLYLVLPALLTFKDVSGFFKTYILAMALLLSIRILDDILSRREDALVAPDRVLCQTQSLFPFWTLFFACTLLNFILAVGQYGFQIAIIVIPWAIAIFHWTIPYSKIRDFVVSQKLPVIAYFICLPTGSPERALVCAVIVFFANLWHILLQPNSDLLNQSSEQLSATSKVLVYLGFLSSAPVLLFLNKVMP